MIPGLPPSKRRFPISLPETHHDAPYPVNYSMAPIPTTYRNCRFRSRLEAKWAVLFDQLGIGWQHEPQGFLIGGEPYLPDFLLECGTWVEVKGHEDALDKPRLEQAALALPHMPATGERGPRLLVLGPLWLSYLEDPEPGDRGWMALESDGRGSEMIYGDVGFGNFGRHRRPWFLGERDPDKPWLLSSNNPNEPDTTRAYAAANGARFEHGERGAR